MARKNNYVKIDTCPDENGEKSLSILFISRKDETVVDIIVTEFDYISNGEQEKIQRWIYDGIAPFEDEETALVAQLERIQDGKHYRSFVAPR